MRRSIKQGKKGFTLIEVIIVIIIVGVLASLALPQFFATVEFSKADEAFHNMSVLRQSLERCYLASGGTYNPGSGACNETNVDVPDPSTNPGTLFAYAVSGQNQAGYLITATRNTVNSGDGTSQVRLTQSATGVTRSGTSKFVGIK